MDYASEAAWLLLDIKVSNIISRIDPAASCKCENNRLREGRAAGSNKYLPTVNGLNSSLREPTQRARASTRNNNGSANTSLFRISAYIRQNKKDLIHERSEKSSTTTTTTTTMQAGMTRLILVSAQFLRVRRSRTRGNSSTHTHTRDGVAPRNA